MVAMAMAAAVTTTLRVGALVFDNDYKHPAILAKEVATIDVLSGGRTELGIGAGWMEVDYTALGLPYDRPGVRIDRLDEALQVIKGCYGPDAFSFDGHALPDHRLPVDPEAGAVEGADPHRRRRAAGAAPRGGRGRHRRHQPEPARRGGDGRLGHRLARRDDRPEGRRGSRRAPGAASTTSSCRSATSWRRSPTTARSSPRRSHPGSASRPTRRSRPGSRSWAPSTRSAT